MNRPSSKLPHCVAPQTLRVLPIGATFWILFVLTPCALFGHPSSLVQDADHQDARSIPNLLPQSTIGFVAFDHISDFLKAFESSSLASFFNDPACADLKRRLKTLMDSFVEDAKKDSGFENADLLTSIQGAVVAGLALDKELKPTFMTIVDPGSGIDVFRTEWDRLLRFMEKDGIVVRYEKDGDLEFAQWADDEVTVRQTFFDSKLILTLTSIGEQNDSVFFELLDSVEGKSKSSLEDRESFRILLGSEGLGSEGLSQFYGYVDFQAVATMNVPDGTLEDVMKDGSIDFKSMGFDQFKGASFRGQLADNELRMNFELDWGGDGAIPTIMNRSLVAAKLSTLDLAADNAAGTSAIGFDPNRLFEAILDFARSQDESAAEEFDLMLSQAKESLGVDPIKDLLVHMDREVGVIQEAPDPELDAVQRSLVDLGTLCFFLKDGKAFKTSIDSALRKQGLHAIRKRFEFIGFEVFEIPTLALPIYYSVTPDLALVGFSRKGIDACLRRYASEELPRMSNNERVKRLLAEIGAPPFMVFTLNTADYVWNLTDTIAGSVGAILELTNDEIIPDVLAEIPRGRDLIEKHFKGFAFGAAFREGSRTRMKFVW